VGDASRFTNESLPESPGTRQGSGPGPGRHPPGVRERRLSVHGVPLWALIASALRRVMTALASSGGDPARIRTTAAVGNPKPESRTLHAARHLANALTGEPPHPVIDLPVPGAGLLEWSSERVAPARPKCSSPNDRDWWLAPADGDLTGLCRKIVSAS
jgi:hypothetical protein